MNIPNYLLYLPLESTINRMGLQKSGTTDKFTFYYQNKDHLGTVRETVTSTGAMKQRVNFYPFGGQLVDTLKVMIWNRDFQQYKYNGKEFDGTFGLNTYDYGARQHYPVLARWDRIDPLCEKYYGVSPYAYCGNNPVNRVDPDGCDVHPADSIGYQTILNTLSQEEQQYVTLNTDGYIDIERLSQCQSQSNNFQALWDLVESPIQINVTSQSETEYIENGQKCNEYFNPVEIFDDFKDFGFTSCIGNTTGDTGNLGVTYMPTNGGPGKGPKDGSSIDININPSLSPLGAAETFSHEGYGHALIYVRTGGNREAARHHFLPGSKEGNKLLIDYSIRARKETVKNMNR